MDSGSSFGLVCFILAWILWGCYKYWEQNQERLAHANALTNTQHCSEIGNPTPSRSSAPQALPLEDISLTMPPLHSSQTIPAATPYHRTRSHPAEDLPPSYAEATGQAQHQAMR